MSAKAQADAAFACDDCNMTFDDPEMANEHMDYFNHMVFPVGAFRSY